VSQLTSASSFKKSAEGLSGKLRQHGVPRALQLASQLDLFAEKFTIKEASHDEYLELIDDYMGLVCEVRRILVP